MNFYQSPLRKYINQYIYKKPIFAVKFLGQEYFGIMKHQRKLGMEFRWYMIHGITWLYKKDTAEKQASIEDEIHALHKHFGKSWQDILIQLGCIDIRDNSLTKETKDKEKIQDLWQQRKTIQQNFFSHYKLLPTWRQHMPEATITIDLSLDAAHFKEQCSRSGKRYINKAHKAGLNYGKAEKEDREPFRRMRYRTAYDKWFHIISLEQYMDLMEYLASSKQWDLFLAKQGDDIISGSIITYHEDTLVYLYGATDRTYGDVGGHYGLMYYIIKRWHKCKKTSLDLLGIDPIWWHSLHTLWWVNRFKQALGGTTISYVGNFDYLFNPTLYKAMKLIKRK